MYNYINGEMTKMAVSYKKLCKLSNKRSQKAANLAKHIAFSPLLCYNAYNEKEDG